MKRRIPAAVSALLFLTACGNPAEDSVLDLTALNRTMQYSQVSQMIYEPEPYLGQTVQISGEYYKGNHEPIIRVLDEQACCAAEITIFPADESAFDGIENFSEITVRGVFGTYQSYGADFACLNQTERIYESKTGE